ncbi:Uncharacterised protein [Mycobacterium tuberculosis]|nr:Uncharacterised protein [Mycobacterium tuberculosis]
MTPTASRTTLITINEIRYSLTLSGLIRRLPRFFDHISSRNDIEKPS